tara:strand:+ start:8954 stop:10048 length:1095 start_codon:yes stop_codon:yes gene_type:complete
MIIGIDASNIRTGGGKKQLEDFVSSCIDEFKDISFVIVSNKKVNKSFTKFASVKCITNDLLNSNSFFSMLSQTLYSNSYFKNNRCDFVFVPGGIFLSRFRPFFIMSQNMLPFDLNEIRNFSFSKKIKFRLIKFLQISSFNRSNGVIFLTEYAKSSIQKFLKKDIKSSIIPHGIDQNKINYYNYNKNIFNILYVSDFLPYKHNFNVFKAVSELILEGYDITLTLIGKKDKIQFPKMESFLAKKKKLNQRIKILGTVPSEKITEYYKDSSLFLFASTCENLPFILLEAISFGLPVITTDKKPMKDIVNGKNILFNSLNIEDIKNTIRVNMDKKNLIKISEKNFYASKNYTWKKNVIESLRFFKKNL